MPNKNAERELTEEVFALQELFTDKTVDLVFDPESGEYIMSYEVDTDPTQDPEVASALPRDLIIVDQYYDATLNREMVVMKSMEWFVDYE